MTPFWRLLRARSSLHFFPFLGTAGTGPVTRPNPRSDSAVARQMAHLIVLLAPARSGPWTLEYALARSLARSLAGWQSGGRSYVSVEQPPAAASNESQEKPERERAALTGFVLRPRRFLLFFSSVRRVSPYAIDSELTCQANTPHAL